jgi:multicomponent Na+:H+ antiporter subunit G
MMEAVLSGLGEFITLARPVLGGALMLIGAALAIVGATGMLRFPDFYTRLHAASVTDTGAATAMLIGMALLSPSIWVLYKLAFIWLFIFLTSPTATHALANAAYTAGLEPRIGRQGHAGSDLGDEA